MADNRLYVMHLSIHGLIRGTHPEIGTDIDTGGQVRYVLDLIGAMGAHRDIRRVDLLTRKITDARISPDYSLDVENLDSNVTIRRLACGPARYLRKEMLWPHLPEFVDRALSMLQEQDELPDVLHAHYADAGLVAVRLSKVLGIPVIFTGHSLGRFKLANLVAGGMAPRKAIRAFSLDERIEAEEETIENASLLIASSKNEENEQYKLYDYYDPRRISVNPPGCDLAKFGRTPGQSASKKLQNTLGRFLSDTTKPTLIMLARPDPQKNILAAIETFADPALRDISNLVLFLGSRADIRNGEPTQKKLLQDVLYRIDRHDLYGRVAYPKKNPPDVAAALFHHARSTGGVLLGLSRHENFGLTLVEAAAAGLPVITSGAGGMSDILEICRNGIVVDPAKPAETARCIRDLILDSARWNRMSENGIEASRANLSWDSHVERYIAAARDLVCPRNAATAPVGYPRPAGTAAKLVICDIDDTLTGNRSAIRQLNTFIRGRDDIAFGVATGRDLAGAREILRSWGVIEPQFFITSVGTEIHTNFERLIRDSRWRRHIEFRWQPARIRDVLTSLPELRPQEASAQTHYKISYYCEDAGEATVARIKKIMRRNRLQARVLVSRNYCVDILPVRASKGHALRFLASQLNIDLASVFTAGDSGNDLDMLRGLVNATVVANHSGELDLLRDDQNTFFSAHSFAQGVLDGLRYFEVIPRSDMTG